MKIIFVKQSINALLMAVFSLTCFTACEQDNVEPELNTAPGGGTVTTYKAYTINSVAGVSSVYGRVVFYQDNANNTLVQIGLYNTNEDSEYTTSLYEGSMEAEQASKILSLYSIDGSTGEFGTSKFYVISDKTFFDNLGEYNAHVKIYSGAALIALGNVGKNADPVAIGE